MIRTTSVKGSPEMEDDGLAMAIEALVNDDDSRIKDWHEISFKALVRVDPEDETSVQVENFEYSKTVADKNVVKVIEAQPDSITVRVQRRNLWDWIAGRVWITTTVKYGNGASHSAGPQKMGDEMEVYDRNK